jgi:hypothetical protein
MISMPRLSRALLMFALALFCAACSRSQVGRISSNGDLQPEMHAQKAVAAAKLSTPFLTCPPAGLLPLAPSSPGTGHHKVTLSWNASRRSSKTGEAVGYCLYRSKREKAAKANPTCSQCEQVNMAPVSSLNCIDDLVEDSSVYYYVVTSISSNRKISSPSNEIIASIPPADKITAIPVPAAPFCRATSAAK